MTQCDGEAGRRPTAFAGAWPAVAIICLTLVIVASVQNGNFMRPHYMGALVLQTGALLLLLVGAFPWRNRPHAYKGMPAACLFGLYGLFCLASCLWAPERFHYMAAIGSVTAVQGVVWALLVSRLICDARSLRWVMRAVVAAGALASLAALGYIASYHNGPTEKSLLLKLCGGQWTSVKACFDAALANVEQVQGHRNFLAIFLLPPILICLAELFAMFLTRGSASRSLMECPAWFAATLLALMLVALALCKSWGSLIGLTAGAVALVAMRLSQKWRLALLALAAAAGIAAVLVLSSAAFQSWIVDKSHSTRVFMWKGAVRMAGERPVAGWGTGMFILFFPDYKPTEPMQYGWLTSQTIYPHDELLLVGVEVGLIGLALYLAGHMAAAWWFIKRECVASDAALRLAGWTALAGALAMFLHGLIEVSLRFWAPATMYWTMIGLLMAVPRTMQQPEPQQRTPNRIVGAAGFAMALIVVALLGNCLVRDGWRSEWLMGQGAAKRSIERYAEAQREAAQDSRYIPDILQGLANRVVALSRANDRTTEAIEACKELYAMSPGYLTPYGSSRYLLAMLYLRRARAMGPSDDAAGREALDLAGKFCEEAVRQNPYDAAGRVLMSSIMLQASKRNLPQAIEQLQRGAESRQASAWVHYRLATLLAEAGRVNEASAALERAEKTPGKDAALEKDIEALRKRIVSRQPTGNR